MSTDAESFDTETTIEETIEIGGNDERYDPDEN